MKKTALIYGAVIGTIIIGSCILGFALRDGESGSESLASGAAHLLGYLVMIIAFCVIFLAVKRYRDQELGGVIRFGQAVLLGVGITAVASLIYVVGWEIYLAASGHDFIGEYADAMVAGKEAAGMTGAELDAYAAKMEEMKLMYANPLFRIPITFSEILPVGLLVSLIAGAVLRKSDVLPAREPAPAGA